MSESIKMVVKFVDLRSHGYLKTQWHTIYADAIGATEEEAKSNAIELFKNELGIDPYHETCECCGEDYSVHDPYPSIEHATGFDRGCWNPQTREYDFSSGEYSVDEYFNMDDVLYIRQQHDSQDADQ